MTRREMLSQVRANLLADENSPLERWAGPAEQHPLDVAADDTAQATDCYYAEQIDDLVADKEQYCFPKIYKPKVVYTADADGNRTELVRVGLAHMNRCYPGWQSWTSADRTRSDRFAVLSSFGSFHLAAPSDRTVESGIVVAGFALPSLPAAGHQRHQWDAEDDACPLPEWAHNAVVLKATATWCQRLAARDRSFLVLKSDYERDWQKACGEVAAQAAKVYRSRGGAGLQHYV